MSAKENQAPVVTELDQILDRREATLRGLLDDPYKPYNFCNYEYARDCGLIDEFYYDPETGYDALVHILSGQIFEEEGSINVEGFHHEPSGAYAPSQTPSKIDRTHLVNAKHKRRKEFREFDFEPYHAHVAIDGLTKFAKAINADTDEQDPANNSMFPSQYDALGVMQAIRIAKKGRDRADDSDAENGLIVATGYAPMINNKSMMKIRLLLDPKTEKVVTAYPYVKTSGTMKLGKAEIDHYLYGGGASVSVEKTP